MSETEQKETEYVSGAIIGLIQKAADKWQVEIQPDGSQYTKKLWTKDSELVAAVTQKIGSQGAFVCGVSHWTTNEGKPVRSLWINEDRSLWTDAPEAAGSVATPAAAPKADEGMTPEKWDAKERRDYRSRAWAQTLAAFTHTIPVDAPVEVVFARLQPFQRMIFQDVCQSFAFPPDESDIPF